MADTENTSGAVAAYLNPQANMPAMEAKASMQVAVDANPDFEAELRRASARTGVPLDSARAFPEEVKRQAAIEAHDYDVMAAQFPGTTKFLADPENARISHDDVANMSSTESTIGPIRGPKPTFSSYAGGLLSSLGQGADMARQGTRLMLADLFGQNAVRADAQSKYGQLALEQKLSTPDFQSSTAQSVYGGLSSTIRNAPGVVASVLMRSPTPMLATIGAQTEADSYAKYRGRDASPGMALLGATGEAAVEVGTEMLPMSFLVKNMGKVGAGHFLTGLLARELPGEQIATLAQDAIDTAIANPTKTWGEYAKERPEAAYQTLIATLTQAGVMEGGNLALSRVQGRTQEAQHAAGVGDALAQLNELAAVSKVRERDTATAQSFFQSLMQDGRDTVWITPKALAESGMAEQLAQAVPGVAEQLAQAGATGNEIKIPIADLMANMAGPELAQSIIPHLADEPGGFTQVTANEYMQSGAAKQLADEVVTTLAAKSQDTAFAASRDAVAAGVLEQLNTAGRFAPKVNEAYASMVGNFFAVQAAKLGITPEEMAARYPLQVKAEAMPGARTLDQSPTDGPFGPIARQFKGDAAGAIAHLKEQKSGEAAGALSHPDVGGIDLVWGKEGTGASDGYGLAKLVKYHPEVLDDLQGILSGMSVKSRSANRINLESADHRAGVRLTWDGEAKNWLMTAFEKKGGDVADTRTDTAGVTSGGDTARPADISNTSIDQDLNNFYQGNRGGFNPETNTISLLKNADLSTFLHESGHFFLEVLNDVASRPDAPVEMRADMDALLKWFGVPDLATWDALDLEGKRDYHEQFARGFEAYLFEGKAPVPELQGLFSRFRSWVLNVYRSLAALNVELTPEVRGVFDRMLASTDAIVQAERDANLSGLFTSKPDFMTDDEWTAYRSLSAEATQDAVHQLEARKLRDMRWLGNAKAKVLREMQAKARDARAEVRREVEAEVMAEPVYQAWQFLTLRGSDSTRAWPTREAKLPAAALDTRVDNLYAAIAKLGGINRAEAKTKWGVDHKDMPDSGVFGKPVLHKEGGLSIDRMAEKLTEEHYLDVHDLAEFEDKFDRQRGGHDQFSWEHDWGNDQRLPVDPLGDSNYHGKLHTPTLRYMFGEDSEVVQRLIKSRMTSTEGGLDPDVVAEMVPGFASGREMIDTMLAVPAPSAMIESLTDQRMLERHGDLVDEKSIDRAVDAALANGAHTRFLATELNALNKALGRKSVLAKAAQGYAESVVARTVLKDLRPDLYTAAARRAAKASETAFKKGDLQTAAAEKQAQLINTYAAKAAMEAREEIKKIAGRFNEIAKGKDDTVGKTRDMDMVHATRAILAEFGVGSRGKKAAEYLEAVAAYDPGMAAVLRERIDAATENAGPLKLLTVEQIRGLRDEIESLWYLAKRSRQMEVDGDLLDREEVQDQLSARLTEIGVPDVMPGDTQAITPGEVRLSMLQSLRASMRRVEAWTSAKDGNTPMGPFRKFIWNTVKDPADAYRADKAKYLKQLRALLVPIAPSLVQMKIAAPELNYTFGGDKGGMGKVELLHAILHTGNASNKKKLLLGRKWGSETAEGELDTTRWDAFVARMIDEGVLNRADFDFAQGVWNLLEAMKPQAQKTHRAVFGRYFDEVTADPFTITMKGGQVVSYTGGYVPAITDARVVTDAKTRALMEEEAGSLMNVFPSTSKGFTKSRVEYNNKLHLDLRILAQHIDKVLLFSHMEQPIRDVRRVLTSKTVAFPLNRIDPAAFDGLLTPWLNRTARQQVETPVAGSNGLMRFFSVVRARAGMAAMFANVSNTAQQITGFSIAALRVPPKYLMSAAVDFIRSPRQMADAVAEASPYMANRMENEVGAMTDAINEILLNPGVYQNAQAWTQKHTYFLQSAVDNVMGPIIWHGAYNQAMETAPAGLTDDQIKLYARRLADSAVRETQGSTLPEDVSRIETGNAFVRMFSQFAGYFNMQANILGTEFAKVAQDTGLRKGMGRGFYILLIGFLVPAWGATAIALAFRGGPDDEDKDGSYLDDWIAQVFGWGVLRNATAMAPVLGQTVNSLANTFNKKPYDDKISTSPAISMIESAVSVPSDVYKLAQGAGSPTKTVRDVATLISMTVGLPANALAKPAVYATEVMTGKAKPTGAVDTARGVISGVASPASKGR